MRFPTCLAALAALALSGCTTTTSKLSATKLIAVPPPAPDKPAELTWEVENRFRLIATEKEEARFRQYLSAYAAEYQEWFDDQRVWAFAHVLSSDLLHTERMNVVPNKKERGPGANFAVNYDPRSTSYRCVREAAPAIDPSEDARCIPVAGIRTSWIDDPNRKVRLSVAAWGDSQCLWRFDKGEPQPGRCAEFEWTAQLNTNVNVTVRRADTNEPELSAEVLVHDVKIVALGDSFSAGEGNPHSQWRLFSIHQRPAYWLDPRCHRSLISAPSLAAAYVAYAHRHATVTLLHYGCSGASIADGVAMPWAHLETSAGVDERWRSFQRIWFLVRRPPDQRTAPVNADLIHPVSAADKDLVDYPPSQIQQAVTDLRGVPPDLVLLSTGGNDVGFGDIVVGFSARNWTPDLTPERITQRHDPPYPELDEKRQVATFDEAAWVSASKLSSPDGCEKYETDLTSCVIAHFHQRLGDTGKDAASWTLKAQYELLHKAMADLTKERTPVFVTAYPNFVNYYADDRREKTPPGVTADQLKPCDDSPFDGRPGFVPAFATLLSSPFVHPSLGMHKDDTKRVGEFLDPLNDVVKDQAKGSWTAVSEHVATGQGHGYCSRDRWYNTYVDSLWNQGYRPSAKRPLGNFRVALTDDLYVGKHKLSSGDGVVWNAGANTPCFVLVDVLSGKDQPGSDACVKTSSGADPVFYDVGRTYAKGKPPRIANPDQQRADPKIVDHVKTTGPVHPNLYGHCNYAAAIINEIGRSQSLGDLLGESSATKGPATPFTVCSSEAWGFHTPGA